MPTQVSLTYTDLSGIALHCFFALLFAVGLLLLVVWMIKHLNSRQMLILGIVLFLAGAIGGLLTFGNHFDLMNRYFNNPRGGYAIPRSDILPAGGAIMNNMMRNQN